MRFRLAQGLSCWSSGSSDEGAVADDVDVDGDTSTHSASVPGTSAISARRIFARGAKAP